MTVKNNDFPYLDVFFFAECSFFFCFGLFFVFWLFSF